MRAVEIERFGGPEQLAVADLPVPDLADDEVLIQVGAAGVNRLDVLTRRGGYHGAGQPPLVLGHEGAGTVHAVGTQVHELAPGDPVLAFWGRPGFYADLVAVPAQRFLRRPPALPAAPRPRCPPPG